MGTASARAAAVGCQGLVDGDVRALLRAAEELRGGPRALDHARALERAVSVCLEQGRRYDVEPLLVDAAAIYQRYGAAAGSRRLLTLAGRAGVRLRTVANPPRARRGRDHLTGAERQVLALVGTGLSNAGIAERLVVSRRTVETHVSRLYAKLGIPNRVLLAAEANRRGLRADA